jgi:hypothetical protein
MAEKVYVNKFKFKNFDNQILLTFEKYQRNKFVVAVLTRILTSMFGKRVKTVTSEVVLKVGNDVPISTGHIVITDSGVLDVFIGDIQVPRNKVKEIVEKVLSSNRYAVTPLVRKIAESFGIDLGDKEESEQQEE